MAETMKPKPKKRRIIDWEAIERDFRANSLSIRELGRQYKVSDTQIRRKMKQRGVKRSLAEKVRQKVQEKVARGEGRSKGRMDNASDEEVAEEAADQVYGVQLLHQKRVRTSQEIADVLQDQLAEYATIRQELDKTIRKEFPGITKEDVAARARLRKAIALPSHVGVLRDLSVALKNLIGLERQAWNFDKNGARPDEARDIEVTFVSPDGNPYTREDPE